MCGCCKPHICPVCAGVGRVDSGFYDQEPPRYKGGQPTIDDIRQDLQRQRERAIGLMTSARTEVCRTCGGQGIVWPPCGLIPAPSPVEELPLPEQEDPDSTLSLPRGSGVEITG